MKPQERRKRELWEWEEKGEGIGEWRSRRKGCTVLVGASARRCTVKVEAERGREWPTESRESSEEDPNCEGEDEITLKEKRIPTRD